MTKDYKDNQPIPEDPTVPRPMGLGIAETATMLNRLPGAIQQGLDDGAATAQEDFSEPSNFVTKPIEEAGKLPFVSSLGGNNIAALGAKDAPTAKKTGISASTGSERPRPLKRLADNLRKLAGGLHENEPADEND